MKGHLLDEERANRIYDKLALARLLAKRKIADNGCWLFTGSLSRGYGKIGYQGTLWRVHRLAVKLLKPNEFKEYLQYNNTLTCPNKHCFNPDHVYSGTQSNNVQDSVKLGTHAFASKTHCNKGHLLPEDRKCKICDKANQAFQSLFRVR